MPKIQEEKALEPLYSQSEIAEWLKISYRVLASMRERGDFPEFDLKLGRVMKWRRSTIRKWLDSKAELNTTSRRKKGR